MPYKLKVGSLGVYCTVSGDLTGVEFMQFNNDIACLKHFTKLEYQIFNFLNANKLLATSGEIKKVAIQDVELYKINPNIRIAIISGKLITKGLANVYKAYFDVYNEGKSWETKVFESNKEAYKWLNL